MSELDVAAELERRDGCLDAIEDYFRARPLLWIGWADIAPIAGACAWRTRLSELRTKRSMLIEWNRQPRASAYRYLPYKPLGVSAETERSGQRTLPLGAMEPS